MAKLPSSDDPRFFDFILEQMDTFAILDREGRYVYVNTSWARQIDVRPEEVIGRHVTEFYPDTRAIESMERDVSITAHPVIVNSKSKYRQFTSYIPLHDAGEVCGCVIHSIFQDMNQALMFSDSFDKLRNELSYYKRELQKIQGAKYSIDNIVGADPSIERMKEAISLAARSVSNVLIEGETGTGKELVAHAIHNLSARSKNPMIKVNCAAIPVELAESELFGYDYGAFTGAKSGGKLGKFELANDSTLFLDEVNQLPGAIQSKLLRVLQERELERLGGNSSISLNVRLIAATNVAPERLVEDGLLRKDLYYRLNVIRIRIPPLRERLDDLPSLIGNIIDRLNRQLGTTVTGVSAEALERFREYDWQGNVRELQNVMERGMNARLSGVLDWVDFGDYFSRNDGQAVPRPAGGTGGTGPRRPSYRLVKKRAEKAAIEAALAQFAGNKKRTAEFLGLSRTMLYRKLDEYGIGKDD